MAKYDSIVLVTAMVLCVIALAVIMNLPTYISETMRLILIAFDFVMLGILGVYTALSFK